MIESEQYLPNTISF